MADSPSTYPGMADLDPDSENLALCQKLPMLETFSEPSHYDGTSVLPMGWTTTGTIVWQTAAIGNLPAYKGEYYMISPESTSTRDERAYTPFFNLQQGITYTISFASYQEGTTLNDVFRRNTIQVKVGTQHDADFLPVTIGSVSKNNKGGVWEQNSFTFSPALSGPYCFCFELQGEPYSGYACIDNLQITSPVDEARVEPLFNPYGIFTYGGNEIIAMGNDPIRMAHYTPNGTPTAWTCDGTEMALCDNGDGLFTVNQSGTYPVTLTATNSAGSESVTKQIKVAHFAQEQAGIAMRPFDVEQSRAFTRGEIPAYTSDVFGLDYITGPNHYYAALAQRFDVPHNAELTLQDFTLHLTNLRYCPTQSSADDQMAKPLKIKVYGVDSYGNLDESKLLYTKTYTTQEALGYAVGASTGEYRTFSFLRKPVVTGPFYLVIEYSEDLIVDPYDPAVGRTFISLGVARQYHQRTSLYCKPFKLPPLCSAKLDEWGPVSDIDPQLKGMALNLSLKADYKPGLNAIDDITNAELNYCGNQLVSSAPVNIYAADGRLVLSAPAGNTNISSLPGGIYIATCGGKSIKIAK